MTQEGACVVVNDLDEVRGRETAEMKSGRYSSKPSEFVLPHIMERSQAVMKNSYEDPDAVIESIKKRQLRGELFSSPTSA